MSCGVGRTGKECGVDKSVCLSGHPDMLINDYVDMVRTTDVNRNVAAERRNEVRRLGLAGQVGALLSEFKKSLRDESMSPHVAPRIKEEIGDILWYVTAITLDNNLNLVDDVLIPNLRKIEDIRQGKSEKAMPLFDKDSSTPSEISRALTRGTGSILGTFNSYQELAITTSHFSDDEQLIPDIVRLWRQSELILKSLEESEPATQLSSTLGDIMWYIVDFAHLYKFDMNSVASENKDKSLSRWPEQRVSTPRYDGPGKSPDLESFPDDFIVNFIAKTDKISIMTINDVVVGDPLMDNVGNEDGYRFHDVFHFSNVAILGWSPVARALLKRKRKFDREIDEIQDGGRAQVVDEAIVKMIHYYAVDCDKEFLLDNTKEVDFALLKDIKKMCRDLEVYRATYWEWEQSILDGCRAYRKIWKAGGGRLTVSLTSQENHGWIRSSAFQLVH